MHKKPPRRFHLNIQIDAASRDAMMTILQVIRHDLAEGEALGEGSSFLADYSWSLEEDIEEGETDRDVVIVDSVLASK